MIHCTVTGARHYSADLVQGRLEISCILKFEGSEKYATKAEKLIRFVLSTEQSTPSTNQPDSKKENKRKNESPTNDSPSDSPTVVAKKRKLTDTLVSLYSLSNLRNPWCNVELQQPHHALEPSFQSRPSVQQYTWHMVLSFCHLMVMIQEQLKLLSWQLQ